LALAFSCLGLAHGVIIHHFLPILYDRGISAEVAVVVASFVGPMQVAGRLAMMAAERHVTIHEITIGVFVAVATSILLLIATVSTPTLVVAFVILFGAGYGVVSIIRPLIARDILGENKIGAKLGAMSLLYLVGSASAPFVGSLIWGIGGYNLVLPVLIGSVLVGLALYLVARRHAHA